MDVVRVSLEVNAVDCICALETFMGRVAGQQQSFVIQLGKRGVQCLPVLLISDLHVVDLASQARSLLTKYLVHRTQNK